MAVKSTYDIGCGVFSYVITGAGVPEADKPYCYDNPVPAPKGDRDVEDKKGTSVEAAVQKFCADNNGKVLDGRGVSDTTSQLGRQRQIVFLGPG
jgi:hypothetical protein